MGLLEELSAQGGLPPAPGNPGLTMGLESSGMPMAPPQAGLLGALLPAMQSTPLASPKAQRNAKIQTGVKDFAETLLFTIGQSMAAAGASPRGGGRATQAGIGAALQAPLVLKQLKQKEAERVAAEETAAEDRKRLIESQGFQQWLQRQQLGVAQQNADTAQINATAPPAAKNIDPLGDAGLAAQIKLKEADARLKPPPDTGDTWALDTVTVDGKGPVSVWKNNKTREVVDATTKKPITGQIGTYERERATEGPASNNEQIRWANTLRDDYRQESQPLRDREDIYDFIDGMRNEKQSGPNDIVLVYNFVKLNDPNAAREGELELVQRGASLPDQWRRYVGKFMTGNVLGPAQRKQLIEAADKLYKTGVKPKMDEINSRYTDTAKRSGVNPKDVVRPARTSSAAPESIPEYERGPDGKLRLKAAVKK